MNHSNPNHDRLDKKLHTLHFTSPLCGSINLESGKPEYCDFDCPVLKGSQPAPKIVTAEQQEMADLEARLAALRAKTSSAPSMSAPVSREV